jgi:hypothetical protein
MVYKGATMNFESKPIHLQFADYIQPMFNPINIDGNVYVYNGMNYILDINCSFLKKKVGALLVALINSDTIDGLSLTQDEKKSFLKMSRRKDTQFEVFVDQVIRKIKETNVLPIEARPFDKDYSIINCHNGLINLNTLEKIPHSKESLNMMIADANYITLPQTIPDVANQYFNLLKWCCGNDENLAASIHNIIASIFVNEKETPRLVVFYGDKRCLSIVKNMLKAILGNYLIEINTREIRKKRNNEDLRRSLCDAINHQVIICNDFYKDFIADAELLDELLNSTKVLRASSSEKSYPLTINFKGTLVFFSETIPEFSCYPDSLIDKTVVIKLPLSVNFNQQLNIPDISFDKASIDYLFSFYVNETSNIVNHKTPFIHDIFIKTKKLLIWGRGNLVIQWANTFFRLPNTSEEARLARYTPRSLYDYSFKRYIKTIPYGIVPQTISFVEFCRELEKFYENIPGMNRKDWSRVWYMDLYLDDPGYYMLTGDDECESRTMAMKQGYSCNYHDNHRQYTFQGTQALMSPFPFNPTFLSPAYSPNPPNQYQIDYSSPDEDFTKHLQPNPPNPSQKPFVP